MGLTPFFPLLLFILSKYHTTIILSINTSLSKTLIIEIICDRLSLAHTYEITKITENDSASWLVIFQNTICTAIFKSKNKTLFPTIRKSEREYLKKLEKNLAEYCEENGASTLEDLYKDFGTPADVVNSYYSTVDIDYLCKQIRISKMVKSALIVLIISALAAAATYCSVLYAEHQAFKDQLIFSEETFIE